MPSHSSVEYQRAWRERNRDKLKKYYAAHAEKRRESWRKWRDAHPGYRSGSNGTAAWKKWQEASPERYAITKRAKERVRKAVLRGKLIRATACEECGRTDRRIEAAHADYARPLEVRWLCKNCHVSWDRREPKTARLT